IIEVDGGIHLDQIEQDQARTDQLHGFGYQVLRFTNEEVLENLQMVLDTILKASEIRQFSQVVTMPVPQSPNSGGL
ncbi:MAG: DUF559 domain-containing protein, partial [Leptolyngbyaceae bacterium]|nr:DUF559 domain-containing protein [Leptolyngbyaceae bacterium]